MLVYTATEAINIWLRQTDFFFQNQLIWEKKNDNKKQDLAKSGWDITQLCQVIPPPLLSPLFIIDIPWVKWKFVAQQTEELASPTLHHPCLSNHKIAKDFFFLSLITDSTQC